MGITAQDLVRYDRLLRRHAKVTELGISPLVIHSDYRGTFRIKNPARRSGELEAIGTIAPSTSRSRDQANRKANN